MEFWDNIIHAALLGTDKRQLKKEDFSEGLAEAIELVSQQPADQEIQFLNMASVAFNYRKCGTQPLNQQIVSSKAEAEENSYGSPAAHQLLSDILSVDSIPLMKLWLERCSANNFIVTPEWVPVLLEAGIKHKPLQRLLPAVTGRRGVWLIQFNDAWKAEPVPDETLWQTGTLNQRKDFLLKLRTTDPAQAGSILRQAWPQENANTKAELLTVLSGNISDEDVPWLEQLMHEKSQKVKDEALRLLKLSPSSSIVKSYREIVQHAVHIKKEKGFLGIGSKYVAEFALTGSIDESIFKSGIEKVTREKNGSDQDFILYQLLAAVPPSFLEQHYQMDKQALIDLFIKSKNGRQLIPAVGSASVTFKDVAWLKAVIAVADTPFYPQAFELLPDEETEKYALQFLQNAQTAPLVIDSLSAYSSGEWSMQVAREVFKFTVKNQYNYNPSFYNQQILSIPAAIIPELHTFAPSEEYMKNMWIKTSEYIRQLLMLKTEIQQAFPL